MSVTMTKTAAIGGQPSAGFEKNFAQLAYTYIKERAAKILDYLVGFKLIDRSDDGHF